MWLTSAWQVPALLFVFAVGPCLSQPPPGARRAPPKQEKVETLVIHRQQAPNRKRADFVIRKNISSFATVIATSDEGLVIGAPKVGTAFIYPRYHQPGNPQGHWDLVGQQLNAPGDDFGSAVAVGFMHVIVSAPSLRKVYMFRPNEVNKWTLIQTWSEPDEEGYGASVAIRQHLAVVGAPGARKAFLYRRMEHRVDNVTRWMHEAKQVLVNTSCPSFGKAVALASDSVVIGAPEMNTVFVYARFEHEHKEWEHIEHPRNDPFTSIGANPWGGGIVLAHTQAPGTAEHDYVPEVEVDLHPSVLYHPEAPGFGCAVAAARSHVLVASEGQLGYAFEISGRGMWDQKIWGPDISAMLEGGGRCKIGAAGRRAIVASLRLHHASVYRSTEKGYWPVTEHLMEKQEQEGFGYAISISRSNAAIAGKRAVYIYNRAGSIALHHEGHKGKQIWGPLFAALTFFTMIVFMAIFNRKVIERALKHSRIPIRNPIALAAFLAAVFLYVIFRVLWSDHFEDAPAEQGL